MAKNPDEPTMIEGTITCVDGEKIQFSLGPGDTSWQQWGNSATVLFRTVALLDALQQAAWDHLQDEIEDDEEDEDE